MVNPEGCLPPLGIGSSTLPPHLSKLSAYPHLSGGHSIMLSVPASLQSQMNLSPRPTMDLIHNGPSHIEVAPVLDTSTVPISLEAPGFIGNIPHPIQEHQIIRPVVSLPDTSFMPPIPSLPIAVSSIVTESKLLDLIHPAMVDMPLIPPIAETLISSTLPLNETLIQNGLNKPIIPQGTPLADPLIQNILPINDITPLIDSRPIIKDLILNEEPAFLDQSVIPLKLNPTQVSF